MEFVSPTKGILTMAEMLRDIEEFMLAGPRDKYKLIIGTDSQPGSRAMAGKGNVPGSRTCFVIAVIIHREGRGARYYYRKVYRHGFYSMKQRIMDEAGLSLEVALGIIDQMAACHPDLAMEIHLDVGLRGRTREIIQQVVGMITSSGLAARVKPFSFGASKVADRYTKK